MRIGIDARRMYGKKTGVGVYTQNLINYLINTDNKNEYVLFYKDIEKLKEKSKIFKFLVPIYVDLFHKQFILPFLLLLKKIDVFYCPNPPLPFAAPCPTLVTIHDVEISPKRSLLHRFWLFLYYLTSKKAKKIIVVSENTKKDIINILHVPKQKIEVIYGGVNKQFRPVADKSLLNNIKLRYGIKRYFILAVIGTFIPRKNVKRLIYAYNSLSLAIKAQYQLVIVGKKTGSLYRSVLRSIDNFGLKANIVMTGYVPDKDLPLLYSAAELFVFPSLYEGFGLPPLEAMACGTAVIVSNSSSLPEVVGDAAILVNPYSIKEMSSAIEKVLLDRSLRLRLIKKGLRRSKVFSWENNAVKVLNLFNKVKY